MIRGWKTRAGSGAMLVALIVLLALCLFDLGRGSRLYSDWYDPYSFDPPTPSGDLTERPWPAPSPIPWWMEWWLWEYERRRVLSGAEMLLALATGALLAAWGWRMTRRSGPAHGRLRVRTLLALVACAALATWMFNLGKRSRFYAEKRVDCLFKARGLGKILWQNYSRGVGWEEKARRKMEDLADEYGRAATRPWLTVTPDRD